MLTCYVLTCDVLLVTCDVLRQCVPSCRGLLMKTGESQLRKVETILIVLAVVVIGILYLVSKFR